MSRRVHDSQTHIKLQEYGIKLYLSHYFGNIVQFIVSIVILQDLGGSSMIGRLKIWHLKWLHTGGCQISIYRRKGWKKQISSGEITLNVICGGTKFISYMYLPRKTLPDIIDWLWVKVTWSLYICKTTNPLFRMFGTPEGRNCYIAIILRSSIKAASLYVLGRGTVCFTYHETRDKYVVNLVFASYKGQM